MSYTARPDPPPNPSHPKEIPPRTKPTDPRRWYTAIIAVPLLYMAVAYSSSWLFALLVGGTVLFALWELLTLYLGSRGSLPAKLVAGGGALSILLVMYDGRYPMLHWSGLVLTLLLLYGFFRDPQHMRDRLPQGGFYVFAMGYVAILLGHFILLRHLEQGVAVVFFVLIVTWLADTGGYVFGRAFGRHRLAPVLSPNKTMEGFLGGILFSLTGAAICQIWFFSFVSLPQSLFLGFLLAVCGTLGDLTESAIKRSVQVKDSGTLIPGHGGVLDRIDSLLLSAPGFYYYAVLTGILS